MFKKIFGQSLEWHWCVFKWCGRPFKYTGILPIIRWHFYYRWRAIAERHRRAKLKPIVARIGREIQRN